MPIVTEAVFPDGWTVWSEDPAGLVVVFRPDVFDTEAFPAPCLPTIYVTPTTADRRPSRPEPDSDDPWQVTLYLEPEIVAGRHTRDDRENALDAATDLASQFTDGNVDYRSAYQVPREAYLERLDELTGRET